MMSGSKPSNCSMPRPDSTSLRPWAAPCQSTPDVYFFNILKSPGTRSGKWISPKHSTSVPSAFAAVARASGTFPSLQCLVLGKRRIQQPAKPQNARLTPGFALETVEAGVKYANIKYRAMIMRWSGLALFPDFGRLRRSGTATPERLSGSKGSLLAIRALNNAIEFKQTAGLIALALLIVCVRTRRKESMSRVCGYAKKNFVMAVCFLSLKTQTMHDKVAYREDRVQVIVKVPFLLWGGLSS